MGKLEGNTFNCPIVYAMTKFTQRGALGMKHYRLTWMQILLAVCVVYLVRLIFAEGIYPGAAPLTVAPQCPLTIFVSCPSAWCLKTLKPCNPTGVAVQGICCLDYNLGGDDFGCCQYTASALQKCTCIDENGVQRTCVDRYGYAYYSGECTRWPKWATPDPTFRCCLEGGKKGWCEYINYPCN